MSNTNGNLSEVLASAVSVIQERRHETNRIDQRNVNTANTSSYGNENGNNSNGPDPTITDVHKWRNILAFWILGLCNNYGYVVMLSAALDIIKRFDGITDATVVFGNSRNCTVMSTGVLLLADTIPSLTVSIVAPFLPLYINVRMALACIMSASAYVTVAASKHEWQALLGIVITSCSSGLGETSMLSYSTKFNRNVIMAWSSGTGAAGITGALSYAALISIGITPKDTLLLMLLVPTIQLITYLFILREPNSRPTTLSRASSTTSLLDRTNEEDILIAPSSITFEQKIEYLPNILKYVLPLFAVYLCEYFINQGLMDVIDFPNIHLWLDHPSQYRWLQVIYQVGVFVSRSSLSCFQTNQIWLMSALQFANVIYFTVQAIFMTVPTIWFVFLVVFWEGLLGGCCYINTYNRISQEVQTEYRSFAMGVTTIGQSSGIVVAGLLTIPIHTWICSTPAPFNAFRTIK